MPKDKEWFEGIIKQVMNGKEISDSDRKSLSEIDNSYRDKYTSNAFKANKQAYTAEESAYFDAFHKAHYSDAKAEVGDQARKAAISTILSEVRQESRGQSGSFER